MKILCSEKPAITLDYKIPVSLAVHAHWCKITCSLKAVTSSSVTSHQVILPWVENSFTVHMIKTPKVIPQQRQPWEWSLSLGLIMNSIFIVFIIIHNLVWQADIVHLFYVSVISQHVYWNLSADNVTELPPRQMCAAGSACVELGWQWVCAVCVFTTFSNLSY